MKLNLTTTVAWFAAPFVMVCAALVSTPAGADPARRCSNRTLYGDYGFVIEGVILPNIALRGLALQHSDGHGNWIQVDRIVTDGVPPAEEWTPGSGTYHVNPDCTGSAVINSTANPFPIQLHFVIVNQGREVRQVVDANAVTAVGKKVD